MPLVQVSNFSSNLFLTAAAQNLLCLDLAAQAGVTVSSPWLTWFIAAAPPCLLGMLITPLIMYKVRPCKATQTLGLFVGCGTHKLHLTVNHMVGCMLLTFEP
jgi:di/tricarboxylate transporter